MNKNYDLSPSRRQFIKALGITGGGLIVGIPLSGCSKLELPVPNQMQGDLQPNAILQITPNNAVHFYLPRAEMGQGVYSGLTTLIAEELDVAPSKVIVSNTGYHPDYFNPTYDMQVTGGSNSIRAHYLPLRKLAARSKLAIKQAAAIASSTPITEIDTNNGHVIINGTITPYGDFAEAASLLDFPEDAPLKSTSDFKYIGKETARLDATAKVTGTAQFGLDVDIEGLYKAALKRCPQAGGIVKSYDDSKAKQLAGVKSVVAIHNGVAVVADSYHQAKAALQLLEIDWELPETLSQFSSNATEAGDGRQLFEEAIGSSDIEIAFEQGEQAPNQTTISADYWVPYLAHATMEPMNCAAKFSEDQLEIWTSTQNPQMVAGTGAFYGDIPIENVKVHGRFLGGGFGRRGGADYVAEAVSIAKQSGLPIQLIWSREEDIQQGRFRPATLSQFNIGFDDEGNIQTWNVKRAGPNILPYILDESIDAMAPAFFPKGLTDSLSKIPHSIFNGFTVDKTGIEGLYEDYDATNKLVEHITVDPGLPVGFWRSVGHSYSGFFKESMMDECAHLQKVDPVEYRLKHLTNNPRLANVLKKASEQAGWDKPLPKGRFHGVAAHKSFETYVAQVAEVSIENNQINVHKVTCAVDCGTIINPDIVKAQMEGSIIFGLTAALYGEITLKDGAVQQSNFHDYSLMRMNATPQIDVILIDSEEAPTGVGEPGLPPISGAVANAIFTATGKRLRSLPLRLDA